MVDPEIELHIEPDGPADAQAFADAVQAFVPLVREADRKAAWVIDELRFSSAHVAVSAPGGGAAAQAGLELIMAGLQQLGREARVPDGFTTDMVRWARNLARSAVGVSTTLSNRRAVLDDVLADHAEQALVGKVESVGSVQRVFDRLFERDGRREVGIRDQSGATVTCTFDEALRDSVIDAIRSRQAMVGWGRLRRNIAGQKTTLQLWDIEPIDTAPTPPVDELIGVLGPEWTGGQSSVDFVRAQRGE